MKKIVLVLALVVAASACGDAEGPVYDGLVCGHKTVSDGAFACVAECSGADRDTDRVLCFATVEDCATFCEP